MDFSKNPTGTTQMASVGGQGIYQGSYTITGNLADIHVGSTHDHDLFATAGLDWYGNWVWRTWAVMPTAGIGIKQALTSGRITTAMELGNAVARVEDQMDDTTVTANLALELRKNEVHSFCAGYTGA